MKALVQNDEDRNRMSDGCRCMPARAAQPELQRCLEDGWSDLRSSTSWAVYKKAFEFFKSVGLYEGLFRPEIPNPVYDNAAKAVGQAFLSHSLSIGLHFKDLFPGDFSISTENFIGDQEVREFTLPVFRDREQIAIFRLVFPHTHDSFDFPAPPTLRVECTCCS